MSRAGQSEEKKDSGEKEESPKEEAEDGAEVGEEGRKMSRGGLVLSSREKVKKPGIGLAVYVPKLDLDLFT